MFRAEYEVLGMQDRPEKALGLRSTNRSHASLRPPVARDHAPLADAADAGLFVDAAGITQPQARE